MMERTPSVFEPLSLGGITLANRIAVSSMCQYSAEGRAANDWHLQHLGSLSLSRGGLVIVEQTAVEPAGRITHGCLGLYSDAGVKPREPSGMKSGRNRWFVDSPLEEGVWSEPVSEVGFSAPGNYGNSEAFMGDNRSGKGLFRARKRRSFSLCPLVASPLSGS
jgi:hypothetical protein